MECKACAFQTKYATSFRRHIKSRLHLRRVAENTEDYERLQAETSGLDGSGTNGNGARAGDVQETSTAASDVENEEGEAETTPSPPGMAPPLESETMADEDDEERGSGSPRDEASGFLELGLNANGLELEMVADEDEEGEELPGRSPNLTEEESSGCLQLNASGFLSRSILNLTRVEEMVESVNCGQGPSGIPDEMDQETEMSENENEMEELEMQEQEGVNDAQ